METKELKIQIPEGYEIDKENSSFEKIIFKKKENTKPRSWEEYCEQQSVNDKKGYFINDEDCSFGEAHWCECLRVNYWKNVLPSKELAETFLAMMQLMSLRQAWIGDWEPDWKNRRQCKYCITLFMDDEFMIDENIGTVRSLSFPTKEMAKDFRNTFKDLLNVARPLI